MTTLEDLRKANLKEQRGAPAPVIAKPEPPETPLITDLTEHGLTMEPEKEPIPDPVAAPAIPKPAPIVAPTPPIVAPVAEIPPPPPPDPLAERVRAAVLRKRPIPSGVKATVDMSPELFYRAKRYCHEHSNSTLRQLMLEVLSHFLDEEGY